MVARALRPLTDEERAQLEDWIRTAEAPGFSRWFIALLGGPMAGLMLAGAVGALIGLSERPIFGTILLAGAALGLVGGVLGGRGDARLASAGRQTDRQDLEGGQVDALRCTVADAVELGKVEDEGPGFFLEVDDGQLLFLQGQYLIEMVAVE